MSTSRKIRKIKPRKALRGDSLSIDLGLSYPGTMTAWMKRDPNDTTYRPFTIVDNRYLTLTKEETSDYYSGDVLTQAVEGKWYFDVEWISEEPGAEAVTIYTGTILFFNDVTESNGVQASPIGEVLETPYSIEIEQTNHGFNVGDAIKFNGTTYEKAQADTKGNAGVIGLVRTIIDANKFTYQFGGVFTKASYLDGNDYYLGINTAGSVELEPTYDIGNYKQFIGTAIAEGLLLNIDFGEEFSEIGTTLEQKINQDNHGLNVGDAIYFDNVDYKKAKADALSTSGVIGVVKEVTDTDNFIFQFGGVMTEGTWITGVDYFLDNSTSGAIVSEPVYLIGETRVFIGQATAQGLLINIDIGQEITDQSATGNQTLQEVTTSGNTTSKNIIIDALGSTSRIFDEELTVRKNVSQNSGAYSSLLADTKVVNTENGNGEYYALASRSQIESDFDFGFLFGSLNYANVVSASTANGNVVYGNRSSAEMRGSGDLNFLIGVSSAATSRELGASNIEYIRGVSTTAALLNAEKSADYLQGTHISVNLAAGTVNDDISINYLDFDYTAGTVNGDFAYITTKDTAIDFSFVNGTARFIDSLVPLPSRFGGSIEATELIVTGKTSDDVLLGDGSTTSLAAIGDGGIQSIVAGTNVTVDNTDPQNPVVSSSGGSSSLIGFVARNSSTSLNAAVFTKISFSITDYQNSTDWNGTTYTVPEDGIYFVSGHATFQSVTDGNNSIVGVYLNDSINNGGLLGRSKSGGTGFTGHGGSIRLVCTAGDTIDLFAYSQNNTSMYQGTNEDGYNTFSIFKM
jgi:hypothetical protein